MRTRRNAIAVLTLALALAGTTALASSPPAGADTWLRPVRGRVVRSFRAPRTRFGRGHLGADLAAAPGTPVRAAGAGTVAFAGRVGATLHVVVRHAGGLRISYSFLASIRVRTGDAVARGAVLGTTGGRGENHAGDVLHLGLRVGDTFVDPMQLFTAPDLGAIVHLAPLPGPRRAPPVRAIGERAALAASLLTAAAPVVVPALGPRAGPVPLCIHLVAGGPRTGRKGARAPTRPG